MSDEWGRIVVCYRSEWGAVVNDATLMNIGESSHWSRWSDKVRVKKGSTYEIVRVATIYLLLSVFDQKLFPASLHNCPSRSGVGRPVVSPIGA